MKQQPSGRTRRPDARKPGERATLSMRITSDLWHRLDHDARASGRSLSAEAEFRLARSFQEQDLLDQVLTLAYGPQLAELVAMLGRAMKAAGSAAALNGEYSWDAVDRWAEIPYAFNEAFAAAVTILEGRRPDGSSEARPGRTANDRRSHSPALAG